MPEPSDSPYRDDLGPLREQIEAARRELDEVQEKLREAQSQQARRDELKDEISSLERELRGRERKRSLPLLDKIRIASPCEADWESMEGDSQKRFCGLCSKHVYNLSGMSRPEAEDLLVRSEGKLCVRYYQRADGTVLTQDCPEGLRKRRRRWVAVSALAFGVLASLAVRFVTATTGTPTMGDVAPSTLEMGQAQSPTSPIKASIGNAAVPVNEPVTSSPAVNAKGIPDAKR